jgi:hypothetical protein
LRLPVERGRRIGRWALESPYGVGAFIDMGKGCNQWVLTDKEGCVTFLDGRGGGIRAVAKVHVRCSGMGRDMNSDKTFSSGAMMSVNVSTGSQLYATGSYEQSGRRGSVRVPVRNPSLESYAAVGGVSGGVAVSWGDGALAYVAIVDHKVEFINTATLGVKNALRVLLMRDGMLWGAGDDGIIVGWQMIEK